MIGHLRAAYVRNAAQLTEMARRARALGRKVNGFTVEQLEERAAAFRTLAAADEATLRAHLKGDR